MVDIIIESHLKKQRPLNAQKPSGLAAASGSWTTTLKSYNYWGVTKANEQKPLQQNRESKCGSRLWKKKKTKHNNKGTNKYVDSKKCHAYANGRFFPSQICACLNICVFSNCL